MILFALRNRMIMIHLKHTKKTLMTFGEKIEQKDKEQRLAATQLTDVVFPSQNERMSITEPNNQMLPKPFKKKNNTMLLVMLSLAFIFLVFSIVPVFGSYEYVYPVPIGQEAPERIYTFKNIWQLSIRYTIVPSFLAVGTSIFAIIYGILSLTIFTKKAHTLYYFNFIILAALAAFIILSLMYSIGFTN
ncbi:MAG: hypothetical protein BWX74_00266 [Tenericutes bacterium ADurb.Bin087]|nr:MAG: hypothetical protein BWX74_00266 [Tenericutes bacterium ADurb.Bin087]